MLENAGNQHWKEKSLTEQASPQLHLKNLTHALLNMTLCCCSQSYAAIWDVQPISCEPFILFVYVCQSFETLCEASPIINYTQRSFAVFHPIMYVTQRSFAAPAPAIRYFFWLYHTYSLLRGGFYNASSAIIYIYIYNYIYYQLYILSIIYIINYIYIYIYI